MVWAYKQMVWFFIWLYIRPVLPVFTLQWLVIYRKDMQKSGWKGNFYWFIDYYFGSACDDAQGALFYIWSST